MKAFLLLPPAEPAGITFNTLNLTVFDNGLKDLIGMGVKTYYLFHVPKKNWILILLYLHTKTDNFVGHELIYLHCPMITWSPSFTRKHGEMWAGMFECLFSYLKWITK